MSTFYNKFKEEEKKEQERLKEQQEMFIQKNNQPIIIKNTGTFKSFIKFLISAFLFCMKSLFYVGITILSSIGLTVLLNEDLRNIFINFIKSVI
ncbi:hypothetical protein [uncultured Tyzzerella sp.]|uniref:hypothetical protein n=1 Tax=uncultured Tyzzerella sp. TaxID=2321398 RepID=UPI0029427E5E|nr:hypothetical protein [uncultured Tyzzerella sp.]